MVSFTFMAHFYLHTLNPRFEESLSAMLDGKVSASYASKHYRKWYEAEIRRQPHVTGTHVEVYGTCPKCRKSSRSTEN
jgi:cytochrome b subunit of formate dehydrogenase